MPQYGPLLTCFSCQKPIWADYKRVWASVPGQESEVPLHVTCAKKIGVKPTP